MIKLASTNTFLNIGPRRENITEPLVIQIQVFRLFYFWHLFNGGRKFMVNLCRENSKRCVILCQKWSNISDKIENVRGFD